MSPVDRPASALRGCPVFATRVALACAVCSALVAWGAGLSEPAPLQPGWFAAMGQMLGGGLRTGEVLVALLPLAVGAAAYWICRRLGEPPRGAESGRWDGRERRRMPRGAAAG